MGRRNKDFEVDAKFWRCDCATWWHVAVGHCSECGKKKSEVSGAPPSEIVPTVELANDGRLTKDVEPEALPLTSETTGSVV